MLFLFCLGKWYCSLKLLKISFLFCSVLIQLLGLKKKKKKALVVYAILTRTFFFFLQAIRLSLEQALPPEPSEDSREQISKLRVRTPSGEFLERRFLGSCKLQVLFDFVASKGYPFEEFKLLTTFPRRNVSAAIHPMSTHLQKRMALLPMKEL